MKLLNKAKKTPPITEWRGLLCKKLNTLKSENPELVTYWIFDRKNEDDSNK